jgi:cellulose synthase/poly-beta-1,6-N-acetylglucosamine synthase-like glycosyltransferase
VLFWSAVIFSLLVLSFYLGLFIHFSGGFRRHAEPESTLQPSVTVIVPAHNEEGSLPDLLKCLSAQTYPVQKIEIILVDDRSTDRTFALMERFSRKHPRCRVLAIRRVPPGVSPKKNAISRAIRSARGEIVLTTDADSHPGPRWIETMLKPYDPDTAAVLGYAPYRTDGPYRSFLNGPLALEYFSLAAVALATSGMGYPTTCNGANFSYRRAVFQKIGGFGDSVNALSGDDDLFLHRIRLKTKMRIRYAAHPDAAVFNNPPGSMGEFFWQRVRFTSKHLFYPARMIGGLFGIYLFYCCLFAWMIGSFFSTVCLAVFATLLAVKSIAELSFLRRAQAILEKRNLLKYYPWIVLPHIVYVVVFPILGRILKPRWK